MIVMQIIDQAAASANKSLPLPLPPKDNQQAPLTAKTVAADDDVHDEPHEAPNTSKPDDSAAPHETTTDESKHDASGDTDDDTNTENAEKQVGYY